MSLWDEFYKFPIENSYDSIYFSFLKLKNIYFRTHIKLNKVLNCKSLYGEEFLLERLKVTIVVNFIVENDNKKNNGNSKNHRVEFK